MTYARIIPPGPYLGNRFGICWGIYGWDFNIGVDKRGQNLENLVVSGLHSLFLVGHVREAN
jgi:hypothetical protein